MIRYALRCEDGHRFEGWFSNMADFDRQAEARALSCPVCDSGAVEKALMAPSIATGARRSAAADERMAVLRKNLNDAARRMRDHVRAHAEGVGRDFPEEARKIHYGEAPERAIYGQATPEEAEALSDEGIDIAPVPQPDDEADIEAKTLN